MKNNQIQYYKQTKNIKKHKIYVYFFFTTYHRTKKQSINKQKRRNKIKTMIIITKIMSKSGQQKYWTIEKKIINRKQLKQKL